MPKIQVTNIDGEVRSFEYKLGLSLMETLRDEGYEEIMAMCGGCCSCATCHVHISNASEQSLPVIEEDEQILVELADNYDQHKSRLSCQLELTEKQDGLQVTIVDNQ